MRIRGLGLAIAGVLIGLALLGVGNYLNHSTYLASYQTLSIGNVENYISGDSSNGFTSYLQIQGNSTIYIIHEMDFLPAFSYSSLGNARQVNLTYIPDAINVDVSATNGLEFKGTGDTVAAITVLNESGKQTQQYVTQTYTNNPNGYQQDRSSMGGWLIGIAIIVLIITFFVVLAMNGILFIPG